MKRVPHLGSRPADPKEGTNIPVTAQRQTPARALPSVLHNRETKLPGAGTTFPPTSRSQSSSIQVSSQLPRWHRRKQNVLKAANGESLESKTRELAGKRCHRRLPSARGSNVKTVGVVSEGCEGKWDWRAGTWPALTFCSWCCLTPGLCGGSRLSAFASSWWVTPASVSPACSGAPVVHPLSLPLPHLLQRMLRKKNKTLPTLGQNTHCCLLIWGQLRALQVGKGVCKCRSQAPVLQTCLWWLGRRTEPGGAPSVSSSVKAWSCVMSSFFQCDRNASREGKHLGWERNRGY